MTEQTGQIKCGNHHNITFHNMTCCLIAKTHSLCNAGNVTLFLRLQISRGRLQLHAIKPNSIVPRAAHSSM